MARLRFLLVLLLGALAVAQTQGKAPRAARFPNGLPTAPSFFPIGVWLQSPHNAARYRDLGINLYVGLYRGPTTAQLEALEAAGMQVLCQQNEVGLAWRGKAIVGWMHGDEPDNAQGRRFDGYAPPIEPWRVVADYERMHRADPTRPVLLNLGQGAAWDGWWGRGERCNHPEDYPEYLKGCDLASFDIYPVTHTHADVRGKLEFVGRGVQRLQRWNRGEKPVWAVIETGHVDNPDARPTPAQVRAEVWQAIACGASGIVYFAHEFQPQFVEDGLLQHDDVRQEVAAIDAELLAAAPVLQAPRADKLVQVKVQDGGKGKAEPELAVRVHEFEGSLHLFVASLRGEPLQATFVVPERYAKLTVSSREAGPAPKLGAGRFEVALEAYGVRHFRLAR
ncbi:MAG: beta-galactosidase [Planctomycetes bacterium]|nr:beta-galactosidase [Planctomycetota bacterium]MCC7399393.1 beta-galactosidase [Planctomycetota bacterium]